MTATVAVTCPTCFENFEVPVPAAQETPCEVDYDCEICCRPLLIRFEADPDRGEVSATACGVDD